MSTSNYIFSPVEFSEQTWTALVVTSPHYNLLQTWAYAEAKAATGEWKIVRGVVLQDGHAVGAAQVLIRSLPVFRGGLAWLNRGPMVLDERTDRSGLVLSMITAIKSYFVDECGLYLRVAPYLIDEELDADTLDLMKMTQTDILGWASAKLDLQRPESEMRKSLKAKWRGHLSKAERSGLTVRHGSDDVLFQDFSRLYSQMLTDKNLATNLSAAFFGTLQEYMPQERKMEVFVAMDGSEVLGSTLIAKYGTCSEFLATTTTAVGRRKNAGQLLLWAAVLEMKAQGYSALDLSGADPKQTPKGILEFKQGLSATPYRLVRELESVGESIVNRVVQWLVNRNRLQS